MDKSINQLSSFKHFPCKAAHCANNEKQRDKKIKMKTNPPLCPSFSLPLTDTPHALTHNECRCESITIVIKEAYGFAVRRQYIGIYLYPEPKQPQNMATVPTRTGQQQSSLRSRHEAKCWNHRPNWKVLVQKIWKQWS